MKIAVVTGATSDLGKEFVIEIAKHFSNVQQIWVIGRETDKLKELKKIVHNKKIIIISMDLTMDESYQHYKNLLKKYKPRIKILVNCANTGSMMDFDKSDYDTQMEIVNLNCKALVALNKLSIPYMYSNSYIINLAANTAYIPIPGLAVFSATKSMVLSFSRALNIELKSKGINVLAVCSGAIPFFKLKQKTKSNWILKRLTLTNPKKIAYLSIRAVIKGKEVLIQRMFEPLVIIAKIIPHGLFLKLLK